MPTGGQASAAAALEDLLASERAYFRADAVVEEVGGCELARMPGLEPVGAGAVLWPADRGRISPTGLDAIEARLGNLGVSTARIYVAARESSADDALSALGYRVREEVAFVIAAHEDRTAAAVTLREIRTPEDWRAKQEVHEAADETPDGHAASVLAWIELERRKARTGRMKVFLTEKDARVVGAVAAMASGDMIRMKNLVVHPDARRSGAGIGTVRAFAALAAKQGKSWVGCFGLRGATGELLYRSAGMLPVGSQWEWSRNLQDGRT